MFRYILKRILIMIPTLLCVAVLIFTLMYFVPGDVAAMTLGSSASAEELAAFRAAYGLDQPYLIRLGNFLYNMVFHFSFGTSYSYGTPVMQDLLSRFPYTVLIASISIVISVLIGIPLGIACAVKANRAFDHISMVLSLVFASIPGFWLALMLIQLFAVRLGWLPAYGFDSWTCYILPCVSNALAAVASLARQTRASMLEVIRSDYITTARAKGIGRLRVLYQHALPNGLIPIITTIGTRFSTLLGGTIIIETIYSIPGIGSYMTNAINKRDFPVVQGSIVFIAFVQCMVMLLIDIVYSGVDPRIKAQYIGKGKKKRASK